MKNRFNFSNTRILSLKNNGKNRIDFYDTLQRGLMVRVSPSGKKVFRIEAWNRRLRRMEKIVLGPFPTLQVNDARDMCEKLLRDMTMGVDTSRDMLTLHDAFIDWLERSKDKNKCWKQDESRYKLHIEPYLGNRLVSEITPEMVVKWRSQLLRKKKIRGTETMSRGSAHRIVIVLSSIFSSVRGAKNPCSEIDHLKPTKRMVFLKSDELERFFAAVYSHETPVVLRRYLLLSLYTGARKSNVLQMRWSQIDLNMRIWVIPETKNGEPLVVPLTAQAVEVLQGIPRESEWVLIGRTTYYKEPRHAWENLLKRAGLPLDFRLHDLRRTMGSWQAITGASTKIIGASLGHKSEQATAHYAHLILDPVREAMQRAADAMEANKKS